MKTRKHPRNQKYCKALQSTAKHCKALQSTAKHCKALQSTAGHCKALQKIRSTVANTKFFSGLLVLTPVQSLNLYHQAQQSYFPEN